MPYATQPQMQIEAGGLDRLTQIADQNGDGIIDADVIARAQSAADALINLFSAMRFATLYDSGGVATESAVWLASAEAVYQLKVMKGQESTDDDLEHEERLVILRGIADGTLRPAAVSPSPSANIRSAWVTRDEQDVSRKNLMGAW